MQGAHMGWWVPVLLVAVPTLLLILLHLLARLEDWMIKADERAAAVAALLEQVDEPEDVEVAVRRLLSGVADKPRHRVDSSAPQTPRLRRRRLRAALARASSAPTTMPPTRNGNSPAATTAPPSRPLQAPAMRAHPEGEHS